jgi:hypothetical protein
MEKRQDDWMHSMGTCEKCNCNTIVLDKTKGCPEKGGVSKHCIFWVIAMVPFSSQRNKVCAISFQFNFSSQG